MNFPHHYKSKADRCVIRIDDGVYDVSTFREVHPGGAELLDQYHNRDATDVFYAFHSKDAIRQMTKMRSRPVKEEDGDPHRDSISKDFERLRRNLETHGWFSRSWVEEFFNVQAPFLVLFFLGNVLARRDQPLLAILFLGVAMQQAGWMGHDYGHGRGKVCRTLSRLCGGLVNGFSADWWSHKHNTHHAFPNRIDVDSDIHNEPILHLFFPKPEKDVWYRRYQKYYYLVAYAFLFVSWRVQAIQFVLGSKNTTEIGLILLGYLWLLTLPVPVALGSILLGGWLVAVVVTSNHQCEELIPTDAAYNYIKDQVDTTRGVACPDPVTEYLFGGMQYQLEHHLFPFMPRYRYGKIRPILRKFSEDHGLDYKVSGIIDIMMRNYVVMSRYSK